MSFVLATIVSLAKIHLVDVKLLQRRQARVRPGPHCPPSASASCYARQESTHQMASTAVSVFCLRRLFAHTKTIEELITGLPFAEECALLAHMEEALRHIVYCFSDAAKNFGLTISLKKIEMLYQPPSRKAYRSASMTLTSI